MKTPWHLVERDTGRVVVERLEVADGYWSRLAGLQFRAEPPRGSGLLLAPCSSIHSFCMRFTIDVVTLNRSGRVVEVRRGVRPWRVVLPSRSTFAILEVPTRDAVDLDVGTALRLEPPSDARRRVVPPLHSWCDGP